MDTGNVKDPAEHLQLGYGTTYPLIKSYPDGIPSQAVRLKMLSKARSESGFGAADAPNKYGVMRPRSRRGIVVPSIQESC